MKQWIYRTYVVWFAVGLILVGFQLMPPWLEWANSAFLILAGLVAIFYAIETFGRTKGIVLSLLIGVTTFSVEGISAHYDIFFGSYDYTDLFPPLIAGVPIGIGFAWIVMIMAGHALTRDISNRLLRITLAASYVVVLDVILDPVAFVVKQYWLWESDSSYYGIPLSNFIGWFVIAFVWQLILLFVKPQQKQDATQMYVVFWTIVILFTWLALLSGLYKAILIAAIAFACLEMIRRLKHEHS